MSPTTAVVDTGTLQGASSTTNPDIAVFKGIPYAQPPVGNLRWAAPEAPSPWEGTRRATAFGPACPQHEARDSFVWSRGDFEASEDCLYLNIWAPKAEATLPVMVWFHGGAHTTGYAHAEIFEGSRLAARGVVLVTVNYRLGALGFLAHPALAGDTGTTGNYGLMDKIAALEWVQRNISSFGGDPANVTIFGQSAGSQSVCALMTAPKAQGLFAKAIGQSAACVLPPREDDLDGTARGQALASAALGTKPINAETLRALPAEAILQAELDSNWAAKSRITVDGAVLPKHPSTAFAAGQQSPVPLMVGSTANEGIGLIPRFEGLSEEDLTARLTTWFGEGARTVLAAYAEERASSPTEALHAIMTDQFFALSMRTWAAAQHAISQPSYLYFMDHQPPAFKLYDPADPELSLDGGPRSAGSYHSSDLAYVFNTTRHLNAPWQDRDHKLSDEIADRWVSFARSGNPNAEDLVMWPAYNPATHATLLFGPDTRVLNGARPEKLAALSGKASQR